MPKPGWLGQTTQCPACGSEYVLRSVHQEPAGLCPRCRRLNSLAASRHRLYAARREQGLCPRCGEPADAGGVYCAACLERARLYQRHTATRRRSSRMSP